LKLFRQLKNASKWAFSQFEKSGKAIGDAEERLYFEDTPREPIMWVSHSRSFIKAITWRTTGTIDTFILSYLITGKAKLALAISGMEIFTKIFLYYVHERIWNKIKWGRE
jgi:uncharacterized membrane protein